MRRSALPDGDGDGDGLTEPVGRHLTLVVSSGRAPVAAARKASMARHPSAARRE